ncbi:hypothetical protein [Mycolicibacter minnesotensis]
MEANYAECLSETGALQFVVWIKEADGNTFPVAHKTVAEARATLTYLAANPNQGVAIPPPSSNW